MKYFHLVWTNLKRKKLRTFLTLLSITVAFVLFGLLCAIQQALIGGVSLAGVVVLTNSSRAFCPR